MKLQVDDIVEILYGTAIVLKVLESGVEVVVFRAYCNHDWLGKRFILEKGNDKGYTISNRR